MHESNVFFFTVLEYSSKIICADIMLLVIKMCFNRQIYGMLFFLPLLFMLLLSLSHIIHQLYWQQLLAQTHPPCKLLAPPLHFSSIMPSPRLQTSKLLWIPILFQAQRPPCYTGSALTVLQSGHVVPLIRASWQPGYFGDFPCGFVFRAKWQ